MTTTTNCITDQIHFSDEQIEQAFSSIGQQLGIGYGDEESITVTADTIAEFVAGRERYSEQGRITQMQARVGDQTLDALVVLGCQVQRGGQRHNLFVIDFGSVRAAYRS